MLCFIKQIFHSLCMTITVPDEGYSRKTACALVSDFYIYIVPLSRLNQPDYRICIGTEDMLVIVAFYKMKNEKYDIIGTVLKLSRKFVVRGKIDSFHRQIHDRSLLWRGTGTSIKIGEFKLVFGPKVIL